MATLNDSVLGFFSNSPLTDGGVGGGGSGHIAGRHQGANQSYYYTGEPSNSTDLLGFTSDSSMPTALSTEIPIFYPGAKGLKDFGDWYKDYHGYLATVVCVLGIIANVLNIVVLTRKNMISATNCILTGLAISDGLTMVAYLPFALRFYVLYGNAPSPERNTLGAVRFMLFYACFSVVVHTVSIWLTVTLAVFRYIFIRYPRRGCVLCSLQRAKIAVFLVYLVTLIVCIPNFVTITVQGHMTNGTNGTIYVWIVAFKLESVTDRFVYNFNFWIQAILVKLVPCIGLTILSFLLVRTMRQAEQRRKNLRGPTPTAAAVALTKDDGTGSCTGGGTAISSAGGGGGGSSRDHKTNRTTRMLLAVVLLFLLTEFPQGILNLLSGILPHFVEVVYGPLGDLVDILALINNGINFILYCTMSKQFRDTFIEIFLSSTFRNNRRFSLVPTTKTDI